MSLYKHFTVRNTRNSSGKIGRCVFENTQREGGGEEREPSIDPV